MKQIIAGLVVLFGISTAHAGSIFGEKDPRIAQTSNEYPWRTIGKIYPSGCTASLVWHNLVVTAAHCVIEKGTNKRISPASMTFRPMVINGRSYDSSRVLEVITPSVVHHPSDYGVDWAVLRIEKSLGVQYGYLGFLGFGPYEEHIPLDVSMTIVGYGSDYFGGNTAGVHQGCKVWGKAAGKSQLLHDCVTTPGMSGGPIMTNGAPFNTTGWVIAAINTAEHVEESRNPNCTQDHDENGNEKKDKDGNLLGKDKDGNVCKMVLRKGYRGREYDDSIANIACPIDHVTETLAGLRQKYPWPKEDGDTQNQQMLGK